MDPITYLIIGAIGLGLAAAVTVTFWHQILDWGQKSLFPWFDKHLPTVSPYLKEAFSRVDKVATHVRRIVKEAWDKVSQYLLKQVVELSRQTTSNTWIQQVTSWVIEASGYNNEPIVKQITTEAKVDLDDLPPDVREAYIKRQESSFKKDVTEIRKQELKLVS